MSNFALGLFSFLAGFGIVAATIVDLYRRECKRNAQLTERIAQLEACLDEVGARPLADLDRPLSEIEPITQLHLSEDVR